MRRTALRVFGTSLLAVSAVAGWLMLAPRPLGGPLTYVVTDGVSMLPRLEGGDLVLVREASDYRVGDVAAYQSESLDQVVLHRIIRIEGDRFVLQGDNNDFIDEDKPREEQILGKEWVVVPGAGRFLSWIGQPRIAAVLAGVIALALFLGANVRGRSKRAGPVTSTLHAVATTDRERSPLAAYLSLALVGALVLTAFVWTRPATVRTTATETAKLAGEFSYEADARRSAVYPDGRVETGEAIFLNVVDELEVYFELVPSPDVETLDVGADMRAVIKDTNGWMRAVPIETTVTASGASGTIDLRRLRQLMNEVQRITQVPQVSFSVEAQPRMVVSGTVEGRPFETTFSPVLGFEADSFKMKLRPGEARDDGKLLDPLRPTLREAVTFGTTEDARLNVAGRSVPLPAARAGALALVVLLAAALVASLVLDRAPGDADGEVGEIQRRYGEWIVEAAVREPGAERTAVRVATFEDLVRIADRYGRLILHDRSDGIHSYVVEEAGTAYWYQVLSHSARRLATVPAPAPASGYGGGRSASG